MDYIEEGVNSYYKDLKRLGSRLERYNSLEILTANKIVEKIKNGNKDFSNVRIVGVDWARRNLSGFNFSGSKLEWNIFSGCKLIGANFSNVFIDWCVFSDADLSKASFKDSVVMDSVFDGSIFNDTVFINANVEWTLFANVNMGAADFTNSKKVMIFESWEDVGEKNIDVAIAILERTNILPVGTLMALKALLQKYRTKTEKFKTFYDIGRSFMNPKGNLYEYPTISDDVVGSGIYVDKERGGTYISKPEYGMKHSKDKKEVRYKK